MQVFKLNQRREVFQRVHKKLLSHLALVLAGIYPETVLQMELQNESERAVASLIVIHLQDAIAPHLLSAHLTGLITRVGEIFRGIVIGTQAIEAILVAPHRDGTDSHQEAEVHPDTGAGVEVGVFLTVLVLILGVRVVEVGVLHAVLPLEKSGRQSVTD